MSDTTVRFRGLTNQNEYVHFDLLADGRIVVTLRWVGEATVFTKRHFLSNSQPFDSGAEKFKELQSLLNSALKIIKEADND